MKRQTKIPVKSLPEPVAWMLKNATGQQLDYLSSLARSSNFRLLVKLIADFKHYNVYEVFRTRVRDSNELMSLRDAKRGEVAGLDAFLYACQAASEEITRRKNLKI